MPILKFILDMRIRPLRTAMKTKLNNPKRDLECQFMMQILFHSQEAVFELIEVSPTLS